MKIAMIGHKRIPSREGGVEIVVEELSTRLVEKGHQVDAYNRKGKNVQDKNVDKEKKKLKEYKGIKLVTIPTQRVISNSYHLFIPSTNSGISYVI